jgi:hypothetical protein
MAAARVQSSSSGQRDWLSYVQTGLQLYGQQRQAADARAAQRSARALTREVIELQYAIRRGAEQVRAQESDVARQRRQQGQIGFAAGPGAGGEFQVELPPAIDPFAALAGATRRKIRRDPLGAAAVAEFGSVRAAAQALKFRAPPAPTTVVVSTYGLNKPLLIGSRDDPGGVHRPVFGIPFASSFARR